MPIATAEICAAMPDHDPDALGYPRAALHGFDDLADRRHIGAVARKRALPVPRRRRQGGRHRARWGASSALSSAWPTARWPP
jgi:hypothetical protein